MSDVKEKLLRMLFPEGMLDHFEITRVDEIPGAGGGVQIELVEFPDVPLEFEERDNYICHGFHDWQIIHDFPMRGEIFNLNVHRRRWIHKETKQVKSRDWKQVAKGSSLSQEFATFLKGLH